MKKEDLLIVYFVFICIIICACNRTQSAQDVYKETMIQEKSNENTQKNIEIEDTEKNGWLTGFVSLDKNYLYEDEIAIMWDTLIEENIKVKVLDAFYSDSAEAGGDYFKTSKVMQRMIEYSRNKNQKYLFTKVKIENISEQTISYCVGNIKPYVCKEKKDSVEVCTINVGEPAFDDSEDEEGIYYYFISILPKEQRTFTIAFIVDEDLLVNNIEDIYIEPSMDFLNFDEKGKFTGVGATFKLLHIPTIRKI